MIVKFWHGTERIVNTHCPKSTCTLKGRLFLLFHAVHDTVAAFAKKAVKLGLNVYIAINNLLSQQQYGLCNNQYTSLTITDLHEHLHKKTYIVCVCWDLTYNAFNCLNHSTLLKKTWTLWSARKPFTVIVVLFPYIKTVRSEKITKPFMQAVVSSLPQSWCYAHCSPGYL